MQAASGRYVLAAAALAATSAVVAIPLASRPSQLPIRSIETRLVDAARLNIPVNLFDDILNIPFNEVQAIDVISRFTALQRGLVGAQRHEHLGHRPRRPGALHGRPDCASVPAVLRARPAGDRPDGRCERRRLAQQIGLLAAAELPVSASCDAQTCAPITPPESSPATRVLTATSASSRPSLETPLTRTANPSGCSRTGFRCRYQT